MLSPKPWQPEAVLRLILWLFVSMLVGVLVLYPFRPEAGVPPSSELKFYGFVVGALFLHGASLPLIAIFLRQQQTSWSDGFGFGSAGALQAVTLAMGVCALMLPVAGGLVQVSAELMKLLADTTSNEAFAPVQQHAVKTVQEASHPAQQLMFGIFAILLAPLAEELLFRGIVYPAIKQNGWPRAAWLVTSFVFALTHANAMTFASLFMLSMALIWLYERTGNLIAPIVTHSLFNATNFVMIVYQREIQQFLKSIQ